MKKIVRVLILMIILCIPTISFAGDIPEWLLHGENTQTFIGEVKEVTEDSITFVQKHNIKGEFEEGREQTYAVSSFCLEGIKVGKTVLCGYINENNLYVYRIKSFKNNKIQLADDYPMVKRLEEYINNGDFAKAEEERLSNPSNKESKQEIEKIESQDKKEEKTENTESEEMIGGADGPTEIYLDSNGTHYGLMFGVPTLLLIAGIWFIKKRKK